MHGTELREQRAPGVSPLGSPPAVSPPTGSGLPGTPQPSLVSLLPGTGCSKRPFARLQRLPLSRIPFQGQRSRPASSLPTPPFPNPFGLPLHRRYRFAPSRLLPRLGPLSDPDRARPAVSPVSAPPHGLFLPRGIKTFYRFVDGSVHLPKPPDLHSLPAPFFLLLAFGNGSPLLVRYIFGGWLLLKPLGTFPTMRSKQIPVKKFGERKLCFHQPFFGSISTACDEAGVDLLWKKQDRK